MPKRRSNPHPTHRESKGRSELDRFYRAQVWQAAEVLERIIDGKQPADRALHDYFRSHHKMGSHDRENVALSVYNVLHFSRWLPLLVSKMDVAPEPEPLGGTPSGARRQHWRRHVLALLAIPRGKAGMVEELGWPEDARALLAANKAHDHDAQTLAIRADLPDAVADALLPRLGEQEVLALGNALRNRADVDLRVNPLKGSREEAQELLTRAGFPVEPTPYSPVGLRCEERGPLFQMQAFQDGWFEVQDEGSQLIAPLLAPKPGDTVIDLCAGAGGKTLHLATMMENQGAVYACDVSPHRLGNLRPRLRRSGLDNIRMQPIESESDPVLERFHGKADGVLVDAPCSGLGTLRRNPDIAWRPLDLPVLTNTQRLILDSAALLVKPGGRLVYATCSLLPQENDGIIAAFLAGHPHFRADPAQDVLRAQGIPLPDDATDGPYLRMLPHRHTTDGFFGAVLERVR